MDITYVLNGLTSCPPLASFSSGLTEAIVWEGCNDGRERG
jgi:hypothetical protein